MRLNKEGREELRKKVEEILSQFPDDTQKVELPVEILEELLFDKFEYDKKQHKIVKFPVWSGEFLRKLDLSEVDFEDVNWSYSDKDMGYEDIFKDIVDIFDDEFPFTEWMSFAQGISNLDYKTKNVNYSNTNANIDLGKSFEAKKMGKVYLSYCDFSNVNLQVSDKTIDNYDFDMCNLKNTGLVIPENAKLFIYNCDLSNLDLSKQSLTIPECLRDSGHGCVLTNTGMHIIYEPSLWDSETKESFERGGEEGKDGFFENLKTKWSGCYLNDTLIKPVSSEEVKKEEAAKQMELYETFKADRIEEVLKTIDEQGSGARKR